MISFLIRYKKVILIVTLAFFLGSIVYLGLDAYHQSNLSTVAAKVGSQGISYRQLDRLTEDRAKVFRMQGMDIDEEMIKILRQQMLSALIGETVLTQAGRQAGMEVSDYEVAFDIKNSPFFGGAQNFNKAAYEAGIRRATGLTPAEFEEQLRRGKLADRYRMVLYSFYKLTPAEIEYTYQIQNGSLKNFEANKKDFVPQLMDTKMETAQQAFFDDFNQRVSIKTYLQD